MKRIALCISIIGLIIVLSLSALFLLKYEHTKLIDGINEMIELSEEADKTESDEEGRENDIKSGNKKTEEAIKSVESFCQLWNEYYKRASFFVESSKLSDISNSISSLFLLYEHEKGEFYLECQKIKHSLNLIYEKEMPYLNSVF